MSCGSTTFKSTETTTPTSDNAFVRQSADRLVRCIEGVSRMFARRRQRQALLELEDHLLADIGLTRDQAELEARKPFWK